MKLYPEKYSKDKTMSIVFEPWEVPRLDKIVRPYFDKYGSHDRLAQKASSIILDSMGIAILMQEPLSIDLKDRDYLIFTGEMVYAIQERIGELLELREVLTSDSVDWAIERAVENTSTPAIDTGEISYPDFNQGIETLNQELGYAAYAIAGFSHYENLGLASLAPQKTQA